MVGGFWIFLLSGMVFTVSLWFFTSGFCILAVGFWFFNCRRVKRLKTRQGPSRAKKITAFFPPPYPVFFMKLPGYDTL